MKNILLFLVMAAAITLQVSAAETVVQKTSKDSVPSESKSWIDSISIAPVGALKTEHLDGPSQWGAGLDLGANVNPFVSIHVVNLSFEGAGQTTIAKNGRHTATKVGEDPWGGLLVDETDLQIDAKISRFSNESFSLHLVGGAQTDWNSKDYGVNVGLKLALDFSKNFRIAGGYTLRTWLKAQTKVDSLVTAQVEFSF